MRAWLHSGKRAPPDRLYGDLSVEPEESKHMTLILLVIVITIIFDLRPCHEAKHERNTNIVKAQP